MSGAATVTAQTGLATRVGRVLRMAAHVGAVYVAALLVLPRLDPSIRRRYDRWRARRMLAVVGVDLVVRGAPAVGGPLLVVANHVSWLDIDVLNAIAGTRFVAKAEVRRWPVVGTVAARTDTFFIVRGSRRDAARVKTAVALALARGERVCVFPEGTTTDGATVGRFYAALLQAAVDSGVPVQPVALRYLDDRGNRVGDAAFVGDMTFVASLRKIVRHRRMTAALTFGPCIDVATRSRRELARVTRGFVLTALGCDGDGLDVTPGPRVRRRAA
jgi:1-acyl-sn-glycerol-3-phosphate acyltransferase